MGTSGDLLAAVIAAKPGGSVRPGQLRMAEAVESAVADGAHLLVEAGPGTGKSFGYLVPLIASGARAVVSTATKSLQDQLSERDLPFLAEALKASGIEFSWATVKGRANYLCMSRLVEVTQRQQSSLFADHVDDLQTLVEWVEGGPSGDRDDLPGAVADETWNELSVTGTECPGRDACPQAASCFAMAALDRALAVDVVVVNHHLYGAHLMANHSILGEHDVVVFDEGHRLADTMASAFGLDLGPGRVFQLRRAAAFLKGAGKADRTVDSLTKRARALAGALDQTPLGRVGDVSSTRLAVPLQDLAVDCSELLRAARAVSADGPLGGARARFMRLAGHLLADLEMISGPPEGFVVWTERTAAGVILRAAPVDVGDRMTDEVLARTTTVVTSATLSVGRRVRATARQLGLLRQVEVEGLADVADTSRGDDEAQVRSYRALHVDSPFDFEHQARLYVATDLPAPGAGDWEEKTVARVATLVEASGGRALVLSTSHRMVKAFTDHLRAAADVVILSQNELPKRRLIEQFESDETSVLVATMGFWEGIDVPGRSLQLVVLDKVPFPRPNDPLWQARREGAEAAGLNAFQAVDLPRAAVLLAQGAGRLIRTVDDRGVVALLDSRMATKSYGRVLVDSLPPMPGTTDLDEITDFLGRL